MRKLLLNVFVFSLGLALAAVVAFRHRIESFARSSFESSSQARLSIPEKITTSFQQSNELDVADIARQKLEIPYAHEKRAMLSRDYSRERRAEILESAIEQGNLDSLQIIRSEYISFLPEYRSSILPRLRAAALKELRIRFAEQDWLDWPSAASSNQGGPTQARLFVDNIGLVNDDIGRFVETAAQLFHGMYLSVLSGNSYSVKDDLFYVLQSAEKILSKRSFTAIPARLLLDPQIIAKSEFTQELERLRCDLTALHVARYSTQLKTHLDLIEDLQAGFCEQQAVDVVADVLRRLTIDTSQTYRDSLTSRVIDSQTLPEFAERDEGVKKNLAEFYVMSAVDSLTSNSLERAKGLLSLSESIQTDLKSQHVVRAYIKKASVKPRQALERPEEVQEVKKPLRSRFGDSIRKASTTTTSSTLGSFIVYAVLIVVAVAVVALAVLWLLGKKAVARGPRDSGTDSDSAASDTSRASSFDDDEDFELTSYSDDDDVLHSVARESVPS